MLFLFDIDGTLLSSHGAGTRAMNAAFQRCFRVPNAFDQVAMAGCTDPWIFRQGYERHSVKEPFGDALRRFDADYHALLPDVLASGRVTLKPGLPDLLRRLAALPHAALGLLTGNFERGAFMKLRAAGIAEFFAAGAYGSDDEDRNRLVPHALRRFAEKGRVFEAKETTVIGDTPRDIACARAWGCRAVAVATGGHRMEELRPHAPDLLLASLSDAGDRLLGLRV
jgi:phosphoglycolate phosphatase-like HAD superfamily hydrolase